MSAQMRRQIKWLLLRLDYHQSVDNHNEAARIADELDRIIQEDT